MFENKNDRIRFEFLKHLKIPTSNWIEVIWKLVEFAFDEDQNIRGLLYEKLFNLQEFLEIQFCDLH